ncbi:MAG: ABC transporter ATP-binding protein [Bacteroidales bacterium]|nr:ABC transporter ATP-binding protein [Bacteroidales bacterium]HOY38001.1 ABC transporter ATP-binding protein [Bacteroidales bacterium]HQP04317.1 ABC transporter ATP-binding protein [Bacteroidales bacterium]
MAYIEVAEVSKNYKKVEALKNLSFSIQQNEFFGLIGPDGAGKTTLLRIMASLLLPDTGSVTLNGLDIKVDYRSVRKILGYMPGRFSLYQDLSVEENLNFFATVFGTTIHENYHLIRDIYVQIEPFRTRRAGKLSGGMKQKLALCCALIHKPEILILDEPTTGVDAVSRKEFWEMLKRLQSQGLTIIVSTPYMEDAGKCDRVALMQGGAMMAIGSTASISSSFGDALFVVTDSDAFRCLESLRQIPEVLSAYAFGKEIHVAAPHGKLSVDEIANHLNSRGFENFNVEQGEASIEDVFLQLMTK